MSLPLAAEAAHGLKRKKPMPRRKKGSKRPEADRRCSWSNRCKSRPAVSVDETERYCKTHARWIADKLVGDWVKDRDGWRCDHCGRMDNVQWAHVVSRGAPYIRYDTDNSFCLAAACHQNFTLKPAAWAVWIEANHPGLWTRLVHREMAGERSGGSVDIGAIILQYREKAA